jgi:hypothetical protein
MELTASNALKNPNALDYSAFPGSKSSKAGIDPIFIDQYLSVKMEALLLGEHCVPSESLQMMRTFGFKKLYAAERHTSLME